MYCTDDEWARVMRHGPYSLSIHKEGLCPISEDVEMAVADTILHHGVCLPITCNFFELPEPFFLCVFIIKVSNPYDNNNIK